MGHTRVLWAGCLRRRSGRLGPIGRVREPRVDVALNLVRWHFSGDDQSSCQACRAVPIPPLLPALGDHLRPKSVQIQRGHHPSSTLFLLGGMKPFEVIHPGRCCTTSDGCATWLQHRALGPVGSLFGPALVPAGLVVLLTWPLPRADVAFHQPPGHPLQVWMPVDAGVAALCSLPLLPLLPGAHPARGSPDRLA